MPSPKLIALYLPQFHPIRENDAWWGAGFTEWRNVATARPRFRGHHQPHIPADMGFYDLRLAETRQAQADLARRFGVHGFCYYHYWFNGRRLLERPFEQVLESGLPDFPFCLCWANESWTRTWDGFERNILMKQDYSAEDNQRHIEWLIRAFKDDRYIRVDGKPLFIFWRLSDIPDAAGLIHAWRAAAASSGLPGLHLCAMRNGHTVTPDSDLLDAGADAILDFQPNWMSFPKSGNLINRLAIMGKKLLPASIFQALGHSAMASRVLDYDAIVAAKVAATWPRDRTVYPCVFPTWDNSARRKSAMIIQNDDSERYRQWLEAAIDVVSQYDLSKQIVFLNAWNEWAEGCHLEPDLQHGRDFLTATAKALAASDLPRTAEDA